MSQKPEETIRSFVAVNLDSALKESLAALIQEFRNRLRHARTRIGWVNAVSLHLTLKFLGSVEEKKVPVILEKLKEAVSDARSFPMVFGDLGVFPNLNQPRVIWVGVKKGEKEICRLQKRVEDRLSELGFKPEKRGFSPHLTLGRIKALGSRGEVLRSLKELDQPEIGGINVTRVSLMKSTLTPKGAIYTELGGVGF